MDINDYEVLCTLNILLNRYMGACFLNGTQIVMMV